MKTFHLSKKQKITDSSVSTQIQQLVQSIIIIWELKKKNKNKLGQVKALETVLLGKDF